MCVFYLFTYVIVSCTSVYVVSRMHNLLDITSMNHNVVHKSNNNIQYACFDNYSGR